MNRVSADKVPLTTINHGRVFPYIFPLLLNPYSETSGIINYLGKKEGGLEKLKGRKIVVLYHGSPYGRQRLHRHHHPGLRFAIPRRPGNHQGPL